VRRIFVGFGLLLLGACGSNGQPELAQTCAGAPPPRWSVRVDAGTVTREDGMGVEALKADAVKVVGRQAAAPSHTFLGQTATRTKVDLRLVSEILEKSDGVCAVPRRLEVTLRYSERQVRVAREVGVDACLHREVEEHELRHVALDDRIIKEYEPQLKERIAALAARLEPGYALRPAEARAKLNDSARDWLRETTDEFETIRRQRHRAEIDTPEEYARVKSVCNGKARELFARRPVEPEGYGSSMPPRP
jgi:hypothetical protein